jgi:hypothetical protein
MPDYYTLDYALPNATEFDLAGWASTFESHMMKLVRDGFIWRIKNDQDIELGAGFQRGSRIYVEWHYLSCGPRYCWLATQLVGILLDMGAAISLGPCLRDDFSRAHDSVTNSPI